MQTAVDLVVLSVRIPASEVVHITVGVVIDPVVRHFGMVEPGVVDQVRMGHVAVLDDADDDGIAIRGEAPGTDLPGPFAVDVLVVPLLPVLRVVRHLTQFQVVVVLGQHHVLVAPRSPQKGGLVCTVRVEVQQPGAHGRAHFAHHLDAGGCPMPLTQVLRDLLSAGVRVEHDEQVAGNGHGLCAEFGGPCAEQDGAEK